MGAGSFGAFMDAASSMPGLGAGAGNRVLSRLRIGAMGAESSQYLEDFSCYALCEECRHLSHAKDTCPHCGHVGLIDLTNSVYARTLQETEEQSRHSVPIGIRMMSWGIVGLLYVVLSAVWGTGLTLIIDNFKVLGQPGLAGSLQSAFWLGLFLLTSPIALVPGLALYWGKASRKPITRWYTKWKDHFVPPTPARWIGPVAPHLAPASQKESHVGVATPTGTLLHSPLTQQPCVAYAMTVHIKDPTASVESVLMLDERHASSLLWDGQLIDGKTLQPVLKLRHVEQDRINPHYLHQFLRKRGIFWEDGELELREAILPPYSMCTLSRHSATHESCYTLTPAAQL